MSMRKTLFSIKREILLKKDMERYRSYKSNENIPPDEIRLRQTAMALAHARFAYENTTFYRDFYSSHGISLKDLADREAFSSLPIVEKAHVRENFESFKSAEATPATAAISATGGSTGEPLRLMRDLRMSIRPLEWRLFDWWGIDPSDNIAVCYRKLRNEAESRKHKAFWWPSRRILLDAFDMNRSTIETFAKQWQSTKPELFWGYAGGVLELARRLQELGISVPAPIAVATTASPLTVEQRDEISEILGAPVFDHYRSAEIPWMGGECSFREGHHVFADARVIELVDEHDMTVQKGPGEVVASDLTNRVFPLIRYRLGDRTEYIDGACSCGMSLPRIKRVVGRSGDSLKLPDGSWIVQEGLFQIFSKSARVIKQFRLHQKKDYSVEIECVLAGEPDAREVVQKVVEDLRDTTKRQVRIDWREVAEIEHIGGKMRPIRSDVN